MTPEEINEAIELIVNPEPLYYIVKHGLYCREKAAGYTSSTAEAWKLPYSEAKRLEYLHGSEPVTIRKAEPQNYHGDLNAMRQARKTLTEDQQEVYAAQIVTMLGWDRAKNNVFRIADADSSVHAEAFLRVHNLWRE